MRAVCIAAVLWGDVGSALAALLMARSGAFLRWKGLFAFLWLTAAQAAFDVATVLAGITGAHWVYLLHWTFGLALDGCEVVLMVEIAQSLAGVTPTIRAWIASGVQRFAGGTLALFAIFDLAQPSNGAPVLASMVARLDLAISEAWGVTFAAICGLAILAYADFSREARCVSVGLLIELASTNSSALLRLVPVNGITLTVIQACAYSLSLVAFCLPFIATLRSLPRIRLLLPVVVESKGAGSCC